MRKIAVGVVVAAMTLAACGSSSKNSTATGGGGTTAPGGGGGNSDLSALAAQYAKAKIKITYTSGDKSTMTIAQDGTGKSAFTSDSSTFYTDGKTTISCDGTGSTAKCTDLGSLGGPGASIAGGITSAFSALASLLSSLSGGDKSSQTIAGRDATCVTYKASDVVGRLGGLALFKGSVDSSNYDPTDSATICVDKQTGFLLKVSGTQKGKPQDELVATAVSEPTDSDFTPPVTPETIPKITLPGGSTVPGLPGQ